MTDIDNKYSDKPDTPGLTDAQWRTFVDAQHMRDKQRQGDPVALFGEDEARRLARLALDYYDPPRTKA